MDEQMWDTPADTPLDPELLETQPKWFVAAEAGASPVSHDSAVAAVADEVRSGQVNEPVSHQFAFAIRTAGDSTTNATKQPVCFGATQASSWRLPRAAPLGAICSADPKP